MTFPGCGPIREDKLDSNRNGTYRFLQSIYHFPCSFKKVANPRKPKPSPVSAAPKVEAFDMIANDFSDDYSGLKNYVILPSRARTDPEPPTYPDSQSQSKKGKDSPLVLGGV